MQAPILLPDLGAPSVVLSAWYADPGEHVYEGDRLVEVLLQGATFDVRAPATGLLLEQHVGSDELLTAGQVLGIVEVEDA